MTMTSPLRHIVVSIAALALITSLIPMASAQQAATGQSARAQAPAQAQAIQSSAAQQRFQQAVNQGQVQRQLQQNQVEHQLHQNATELSRRPATAADPTDRQTQMTLQAQNQAYQARQRAAVDRYNSATPPVVQRPVRKAADKPASKKP